MSLARRDMFTRTLRPNLDVAFDKESDLKNEVQDKGVRNVQDQRHHLERNFSLNRGHHWERLVDHRERPFRGPHTVSYRVVWATWRREIQQKSRIMREKMSLLQSSACNNDSFRRDTCADDERGLVRCIIFSRRYGLDPPIHTEYCNAVENDTGLSEALETMISERILGKEKEDVMRKLRENATAPRAYPNTGSVVHTVRTAMESHDGWHWEQKDRKVNSVSFDDRQLDTRQRDDDLSQLRNHRSNCLLGMRSKRPASKTTPSTSVASFRSL